MSELQELFLTQVLPRLAIAPGDRILDVGCGDGWAARAAAALATQGMVVGLDASGEAIRTARRESRDFDNILYIEAEAEENPWQDDFFSHALLIDTLTDLKDAGMALRHVLRVLSGGGKLWIVSPVAGNGLVDVSSGDGVEESPSPIHAEEFIALLKTSGFDAVESVNLLSAMFDDLPVLLIIGRKVE